MTYATDVKVHSSEKWLLLKEKARSEKDASKLNDLDNHAF